MTHRNHRPTDAFVFPSSSYDGHYDVPRSNREGYRRDGDFEYAHRQSFRGQGEGYPEHGRYQSFGPRGVAPEGSRAFQAGQRPNRSHNNHAYFSAAPSSGMSGQYDPTTTHPKRFPDFYGQQHNIAHRHAQLSPAWNHVEGRKDMFRTRACDFGWGTETVMLNGHTTMGIHREKQRYFGRRLNSTAFDRFMRDTDQRLKRASSGNGIFKGRDSASRRTMRRACRRRRQKVGELQIRAFEKSIRKLIDENPIKYVDCSPLEDFIIGMREKTSNEFMGWFEDVLDHSRKMLCLFKFDMNDVWKAYDAINLVHHMQFIECVRVQAFGPRQGHGGSKPFDEQAGSDRAKFILSEFKKQFVKFVEFVRSTEMRPLTQPVTYSQREGSKPGTLYHECEEFQAFF